MKLFQYPCCWSEQTGRMVRMRTLVRHADCTIVHQGDVLMPSGEWGSPASFLFEYIVCTIFLTKRHSVFPIDLVQVQLFRKPRRHVNKFFRMLNS
jgi:hypothetical protein